MNAYVLAVDPGREKTGVALLTEDNQLMMMDILPTDSIQYGIRSVLIAYPDITWMVCGNGTNHHHVGTYMKALAEEYGKHFSFTNEMHTTEEARRRYFDVHPPQGWRKLIPKGMLYPPVPVDDITAWVIGERWLLEQKENKK